MSKKRLKCGFNLELALDRWYEKGNKIDSYESIEQAVKEYKEENGK